MAGVTDTAGAGAGTILLGVVGVLAPGVHSCEIVQNHTKKY